MTDSIRCERDGAATRITLNRPDDGNRISNEMAGELAAMLLPSQVIGRRVDDPLMFNADVTAALAVLAIQAGEPGPVAAIIAGLDQALWDLIARRAGRPLRRRVAR